MGIETPVYSAALLLNPTQRLEWFDSRWQDTYRETNSGSRISSDLAQTVQKTRFPHTKLLHKPTSRYYRRILAPTISYEPDSSPMFDEFEHCCQASTTSLPSGPPILEWWISNEAKYPKLTQRCTLNSGNFSGVWACFFIGGAAYMLTILQPGTMVCSSQHANGPRVHCSQIRDPADRRPPCEQRFWWYYRPSPKRKYQRARRRKLV